MRRLLIIATILLVAESLRAQIYPLHWWTGMKYNKIQLMFRGTDMGGKTVSTNRTDIKIEKLTRVESPNYLFADISIAPNARPGKVVFSLYDKPSPGKNVAREMVTVNWELKARKSGTGINRHKGVDASDLIYLIMPDRFSNGDPSNDRIPGMLDQSLDRDSIFHRHGGDLQGVINHLDYLQDIGVTAIWLNPVLENNMPNRTEHGYAFTDHYRIDPRIGGEKAYHNLISQIHRRGMKIIQDAVYNHVGNQHFLFTDKPGRDWFHNWPAYTNTTYKDQVLMDPYSAKTDRDRMSDGWFVPSMPDLDQKNPLVANFLIQHAVWSTEEYGLDGWRIDTYAYNDLEFMNRCNKALLDEYPRIHLFGETWVHGMVNQSYFTRNTFNIPYKSNLPGVTDFQLNTYGIIPALTQPFGWTEGVNRLYLSATNDLVYQDPMKHVIFLDNHDISRIYSMLGENKAKMKMAMAWLLTYRGIPQLYYGTEVLMKNYANPDGLVRLDFPGGWAGDAKNKFEASGRTEAENEVFSYFRSLALFRRQCRAITSGKMMQYVPEDGVYVYFRYNNRQTIMCVMNPENKTVELSTARFSERTNGFSSLRDVVTNRKTELKASVSIPPVSLMVWELGR